MGKKRKADATMDLERGLYCSFVAAANSVSQLYTQASAQQRQSRDAGARAALERVFNWVVREHGTQAGVPTAALLEFLRQEMQATDNGVLGAASTQVPFPASVPLPQYTSGVQPSPAKRHEAAFQHDMVYGQGMAADMDECSESDM